jgi:putative Mg2+ transporter-C (MgtC) family protein
MSSLPLADIFLRMLTALACGAVIGLNRDLHHKPAGFRTFGLVSLGSAAVTLLMLQMPGSNADSVSRVIQGVVTGIGFLGAGVILHRAAPVKVAGLTTAAAVWLTAGLGVAAGAGQFAIAWVSLALAMVLLITGGAIERLLERLLGRDRERKRQQGP